MRNNDIENLHTYNIDIKNREIYLHPNFIDSDDSGVDFVSAVYLHKNLRYLNTLSNDPIVIHMHIQGGDWCDCLSMYDSIKASYAPVAIIVYSRAESSGSVILQAADLRIMMPNAYTLIHYGSTYIDSDHKVAASHMKWNQEEANKMVNIFTEKLFESPMARTKKWKSINNAKKHILSQLDHQVDWVLRPQESVDYGFADGIMGDEEYPDINSIKKYLKNNYT
jgi:ATP-dependent protease ClpP protease subunit